MMKIRNYGIAAGLALLMNGVNAQTVSTLVGTPGQEGWSPTTVSIGTAGVMEPWGLVVDAQGRLWFTESGASNRVRVIDFASSSVINKTGYFLDPYNPPGGGGNFGYINATGNVARYDSPRGIDVDADGNFYIADYFNHVIRKVSPVGSMVNTAQTVSTFAGAAPPGVGPDYQDGTGTAARFASPIDVAVDANGNVYVADNGNNMIRKISPAGVVTTLAGSLDAGDVDAAGTLAKFDNIMAVEIYDADHIIVADANNNKIRKVNINSGLVTTIAGLGANKGGNKDGDVSEAEFRHPTGLAVDNFGNIYVAEGFDGQSNIIRRISGTTVSTIAGAYQTTPFHRDGQGPTARFQKPTHLAFNAQRNVLYVSEVANHTIRAIDLRPIAQFSASTVSTNVNVLVTLTDESLNNPTSWNWTINPPNFTFESGSSASSKNPRIRFTQAGTYTVALTAINGFGQGIETKNNFINVSATSATNPPVVEFSASSQTGMVGDIIQLTDNSTNSPYDWEWTILPTSHEYVNGTSRQTQNPEVRFTAVAKYTVILKATNDKGSNSKVKSNYIDITPLGLNKLSLRDALLVYPNPSNGSINLKFVEGLAAGNDLSVMLMDMSGKLVYRSTLLQGEKQLSLNQLKAGVYMLRVEDGENLFFEQIIVQ